MTGREKLFEKMKLRAPDAWQKYPELFTKLFDEQMAEAEANIDLDKRISEAITKAKEKYLEEAGETVSSLLAEQKKQHISILREIVNLILDRCPEVVPEEDEEVEDEA
jgi:hypothetical protein